MYKLSVFRSPIHRGKKKDTQIHRLGVDLRTEINCKGIKRGVRREVSENFIKLCFDLQNKYNSR